MARPHVVIVDAGFGGLADARALARAKVDVTLIDRRNHHLFQPLLYQVATAGLSPADIAAPIRAILRGQRNDRDGRSQPFRYRDYGKLATIGRHRAVIEFGRIRLSGTLAWLLWCTAHIFFLAGYRNRLIVGANWLWNYLSFERGARLITGDPIHQNGEEPWPA